MLLESQVGKLNTGGIQCWGGLRKRDLILLKQCVLHSLLKRPELPTSHTSALPVWWSLQCVLGELWCLTLLPFFLSSNLKLFCRFSSRPQKFPSLQNYPPSLRKSASVFYFQMEQTMVGPKSGKYGSQQAIKAIVSQCQGPG